MAVNFFILQSSGKLTKEIRKRLQNILTNTLEECTQKLVFGDVDVIVVNNPVNVVPRLGAGGMCFDAHQIQLTLDIDHPYLTNNFQSCVRALFAHELHHCARALARGSSHSGTYGGSLVAEGLACCFEEEIGEPTPFYAIECSRRALQRFSKKAKKHVHTRRQDMPGGWPQWMYGRDESHSKFPYQCGYSTGYALVSEWLKLKGLTASETADIDESIILDDWINGLVDPFRSSRKEYFFW